MRSNQDTTPELWSRRGEAVTPGVRPLHIWQGIVGERCSVHIVERGRNRYYARWLGSEQPDPHRVTPSCGRYDACGGCPHMHLDLAGQHLAKQRLVARELGDFGPIDPIVPSPDGLSGYRHVLKLVAGYSDRGSPRLGAPSRHQRRIVPIPECEVVTPELRDLMRSAAHWMRELELRPWTPERGGLLRFLHARQSRHTGALLVTLICARENGLVRKYAEAIAQGPVAGVHLHINDRVDNTIFDRDEQGGALTQPLLGRDYILDRLAGVDYRIGPTDFFQTNPGVADRLYQDVIELAGAENGVPLVDLYCGVGSFAMALARRTGWAMGVESNPAAVQAAIDQARAAGIPAEFTAGEVLDVLPVLARRLVDAHPVVIVDPARRGLEEGVMDAILALQPRRVVYVSCNPVNMAPDIAAFAEAGWRVRTLRPYDMFPNTAHVEVVGVLEAPEGSVQLGRRGPRRRVVRSQR